MCVVRIRYVHLSVLTSHVQLHCVSSAQKLLHAIHRFDLFTVDLLCIILAKFSRCNFTVSSLIVLFPFDLLGRV